MQRVFALNPIIINNVAEHLNCIKREINEGNKGVPNKSRFILSSGEMIAAGPL